MRAASIFRPHPSERRAPRMKNAHWVPNLGYQSIAVPPEDVVIKERNASQMFVLAVANPKLVSLVRQVGIFVQVSSNWYGKLKRLFH
jgi:hypothetical protein